MESIRTRNNITLKYSIMSKKWELYEDSKKRFKNQQKTHGFCNWQIFQDNFLLECWNMENENGQIEPTIIQFWKNGAGYEIFRAESNKANPPKVETKKSSGHSHEIKTEILQICEAFKLGSFKNSLSYSDDLDGYIKTEFETSTGNYVHYFRIKSEQD